MPGSRMREIAKQMGCLDSVDYGTVEWWNCHVAEKSNINEYTTFPDKGIVILQVGRSGDTTAVV